MPSPEKEKAKKEFRSTCPICRSLDLLGDKWTLLIIRDLILGESRFKDFAGGNEKIPTNVLSERLDRLQRYGIVEKVMSDTYPKYPEYRLTKKGEELSPLIAEFAAWGKKNIPGSRMPKGTPWS